MPNTNATSSPSPSPSPSIVIVGGGHAGLEAAWAAAAANLGTHHHRVLMVTLRADRIGAMSCNPAIGGLAKGQIVREIDALGGLMGQAIDATGIQFRVLNTSRGGAVHGPRAQADKPAYARKTQQLIATRHNIHILEAQVTGLEITGDRCTGVRIRYTNQPPDAPEHVIPASAVVLTTGTFMSGLMHTGTNRVPGGRVGEQAAILLSRNLRHLGFELGRFKTGTPPRLRASSIDFSVLPPQYGDDPPLPFSELTDTTAAHFPVLPQVPCHTTHTNSAIHDLIRDNLDRAPMYSGQIEAECGPRYCPSIEDKVVRFADRDAHHVFLEPESHESDWIYCNGISTSLPADVQDRIVPMMLGCERAEIVQYGYAVEYDMVRPHQIDATCMTKRYHGLFLAGQINGTSGYEEAAGQGLLAGLNAARYARGDSLVRLTRDTSYIGVMMDDLVTKTPREPYRMFTSRAEHRIALRADNAPDRLTPLGRDLGLVTDERWQRFCQRRESLQHLHRLFEQQTIDGLSLRELARSGSVDSQTVLNRLNGASFDRRLAEVVFNNCRYESYLIRQASEIRKMADLETRRIPADFRYDRVNGLRNEAVEVLSHFRPATMGQASRLAGVNPADLTLLAVSLKAAATAVPPPDPELS